MEIVTIVDEKDNVIGEKERTERTVGDIYRVASLWLTNEHGEVLLARRTLTKKTDPGVWDIGVSGTVAAGETYEENIRRETREEIGIDLEKTILGPKQFISDGHKFFAQIFIAQVDSKKVNFVLQEDEVDAVKWISTQDLIEDYKNNPEEYVKSMSDVIPIIPELQKYNSHSPI